MKIGILQTGRAPDALRLKHGDYNDLFKNLLAGHGFTFETYAVLDGVLPKSIDEADGWLITGSKFGVYEDHPWIAPLEAFLRAAYAQSVPIVGVCFGHQILAQALGGKVEKFSGGWSVGATDYSIENGPPERIMAWHQDQVVRLPADAKVIGSSDFCANAMLAYGDKALTVQPHPEFTPEFMADLLKTRGQILPTEIYDKADALLSAPLTSMEYANTFATFFKQNRRPNPIQD
jgi:GMP synthase-like glutamine amidotransferase